MVYLVSVSKYTVPLPRDNCFLQFSNILSNSLRSSMYISVYFLTPYERHHTFHTLCRILCSWLSVSLRFLDLIPNRVAAFFLILTYYRDGTLSQCICLKSSRSVIYLNSPVLSLYKRNLIC